MTFEKTAHPFAVEMKTHFAMRTALATVLWGVRFFFRITSDKEQIGDLVLHKVISSVIPHPFFVAKNHFAPIVFAMIMTEIFHFTSLEAATFARVEMEHVVLPGIFRHSVAYNFRQEHGLLRCRGRRKRLLSKEASGW